jgi:ribonucleoside-diphosphate reductase alpha chain
MGKNISKKATAPGGKGLKVERYFSKEGKNVYDLFKYEKRSSVIRNPSGFMVAGCN